jgi:hypothetical protein
MRRRADQCGDTWEVGDRYLMGFLSEMDEAHCRCPKCGEPMRIIAFMLDRPQVERILAHIGEPTQPPAVLTARSPPQGEFGFDQTPATADWPEMDQTAGRRADGGE